MKLKVRYRGKIHEVQIDKEKVKAKDILDYFNLSPEFAFVAKNGEIVSEDEKLSPQDEIKVVNAISGG